eukprot:7145121-Prymnesium_polylepis.4
MVVYFCARPPIGAAHCANVKCVAPADSSAARSSGMPQMEPASAASSQYAAEPLSLRSAGFSTAQGTCAAWHARTSAAVKSARRLCFSTYASQPRGGGCTPRGRARDRSRTGCRTEKELHGGAAKTTSKSPPATPRSRRPRRSARVKSCSAPPSLVSMAVTVCPSARSRQSSACESVAPPANASSTRSGPPPAPPPLGRGSAGSPSCRTPLGPASGPPAVPRPATAPSAAPALLRRGMWAGPIGQAGWGQARIRTRPFLKAATPRRAGRPAPADGSRAGVPCRLCLGCGVLELRLRCPPHRPLAPPHKLEAHGDAVKPAEQGGRSRRGRGRCAARGVH